MVVARDPRTLSRERYSRLAQGYITSKTHAQGQDLERLVEIARPRPDWVVLDIATGGGHTALKFATSVGGVFALDIAPGMLEKAEVYVHDYGGRNVIFMQADAEALPVDDAVFDLVTCRIAPHHFPDPARFLEESARVLVPGGILLVQDHVLPEDEEAARYVDDFERLRDPSHNRAYSQSEWLGMLASVGLRVEHVEQVVKLHQFVSWTERQGCSPDTNASLIRMIDQAPEIVTEWLQPHGFGSPGASFVNRHAIIAGRKS